MQLVDFSYLIIKDNRLDKLDSTINLIKQINELSIVVVLQANESTYTVYNANDMSIEEISAEEIQQVISNESAYVFTNSYNIIHKNRIMIFNETAINIYKIIKRQQSCLQ